MAKLMKNVYSRNVFITLRPIIELCPADFVIFRRHMVECCTNRNDFSGLFDMMCDTNLLQRYHVVESMTKRPAEGEPEGQTTGKRLRKPATKF